MGNQAKTKEITAEQLIEVLKFTPRTYKISMWGYGGEKVMGTVDREVWDYCMEHSVDLSDIAWSDEDTVRDDMGLDPERLPFPPGSWYECDNLAHVHGVSRNAGTLQITDENDEVVFEQSLDDLSGDPDDGSPEWNCMDEVWIGQEEAGKVVFVGSSNEKGTFFEGEIELKEPFDITKLTLSYDEVDGEELVNGVQYDGEDIDNWGGSTDGKSSDFTMCLVGEDGEWERYAPEDKDWGHPEYGTSPSDWEKTVDFNFAKHQPVHPGYYNAVWSHFGTTYGSLYWDGSNFGEWEYGKFNAISGVKTWSGYNWDTSSWANRPPEPVDVACDNKKCGWVGMESERIEDAEYNNHCPACNGTEFSWIDYDPNTKAGLKNREKYCVPALPPVGDADLEKALEELKAEFEALCEEGDA